MRHCASVKAGQRSYFTRQLELARLVETSLEAFDGGSCSEARPADRPRSFKADWLEERQDPT